MHEGRMLPCRHMPSAREAQTQHAQHARRPRRWPPQAIKVRNRAIRVRHRAIKVRHRAQAAPRLELGFSTPPVPNLRWPHPPLVPIPRKAGKRGPKRVQKQLYRVHEYQTGLLDDVTTHSNSPSNSHSNSHNSRWQPCGRACDGSIRERGEPCPPLIFF